MSISDFLDMMPHTVTHAAFLQRTTYGVPSYGSPTSYRARVVYKQKLLKRADGSDVMASGHVWLATAAIVVTTEDKITLPDLTTPPLLQVDIIPDEDGAHHIKVWFR